MNSTGIAVIGIGCKFPGANNKDELWKLLCNGLDSLSEFTDEQLKQSRVPEDYYLHPNYVKRRGVLAGLEFFDASLFRFTADEVPFLDLRARNLLHVTQQALEDAKISPTQCPTNTCVYIGANSINPNSVNALDSFKMDIKMMKHYSYSSSLAGLIAYQYSLNGAAMLLNSACATSLLTIAKACEDLLLKNSDLAIAGGVSIDFPQEFGHLYEKEGICSKDGYCKTLAADASGAVFSNGVGIVILKRLEDAIKDKDNIQSVILGHAVNNDASEKISFLSPSIAGQHACIQRAWQKAGVDGKNMNYIEMHGAATVTGDPIEFYALKKVFANSTEISQNNCGLGCIKTNIGHTRVASGIAGFIKTSLMLQHKMFVPTLHINEVNSLIDLEDSPFFICKKTEKFPGHNMTAGVSSMGFGGTNIHIVMRNYLL